MDALPNAPHSPARALQFSRQIKDDLREDARFKFRHPLAVTINDQLAILDDGKINMLNHNATRTRLISPRSLS